MFDMDLSGLKILRFLIADTFWTDGRNANNAIT